MTRARATVEAGPRCLFYPSRALSNARAKSSGTGGGLGARARMGFEVDLFDPLAREVGVELGRRDVRVPQHLLDRSKVAAAGQQMGGEGMAQRVRAHAAGQAHIGGVALDHLVEALPGERSAAKVHEETRHRTAPHEVRPAGAQVALGGGRGLTPERNDALLVALPVRAHEGAPQIDVVDVEAHRLRGSQPAAVHHLEQRPVPKLNRIAARHALEKLLDLGVAEDSRKLAALGGWAEGRGWVLVDQLLATQVPVEGAQAG